MAEVLPQGHELFNGIAKALKASGVKFTPNPSSGHFEISVAENRDNLVKGTANEKNPNANARRLAAKLRLFGIVSQQAALHPKSCTIYDGWHVRKNKNVVATANVDGLRKKLSEIHNIDSAEAAALASRTYKQMDDSNQAGLISYEPGSWVVRVRDLPVVDANEPATKQHDGLISAAQNELQARGVRSYERGGRLVVPIYPNLEKILAEEYPKGVKAIGGLPVAERLKHVLEASQRVATLVESLSHRHASRQLTLSSGVLRVGKQGSAPSKIVSWIIESHERPQSTLE